VWILIDLVAMKISSRPFGVVQTNIENGIETFEALPGHELNGLIQAPNDLEDYHAWMYRYLVELCLMGNGMYWFQRQKEQMFVLQTEKMHIDFDKKGGIKEYQLTTTHGNGGSIEIVETFPAHQVGHARRPNPNSMYWGLSPFIPGRKSILFNRYSMDYLNSFYLKQATPGLILKLDRNVNENVALRQLRSFELAHAGRVNQKRTMILPKGVEADTVTPSIADQNLTILVNQNRDTIRNIFKVPPHELGLQGAGSLGSEEHKISLVNFWEATLLPTMRIVEGAMTKFFRAQDMLGDNQRLKFDTSKVEALQANNEKRAKEGERMLKAGLSVNEVRGRIWDEQPEDRPDADLPFVMEPAPREVDRTEEQEVKSLSLSMMPGITRMVKNLAAMEEGPEAGVIEEASLEFFVHMLSALPSLLKKHLSETKFITSRKAKIDDEDELEKELEEVGQEFSGAWEEVFKSLRTSVEAGYDQQVSVVTSRVDQDALQVLRERDAEQRRLILQARGLEAFRNINKTTSEQIMKTIEDGVSKGKSIPQIAEDIGDNFRQVSPGRARTIARTEVLTAASIGHNAAMQNASEHFGPNLKKTWIHVGDERVRDTHADPRMSKAIKFDEPFPNGLQYPRQPGSPASEVINCRCTIVMIPPGG
jgi:HK97 family phage portal protein